MVQKQSTHPIYELKVDVSNTSRLFEYYMLKEYILETDSVLDVGCNTGTGMDILSEFSSSVHGLDVVPELEKILASKYQNNKKISFQIVNEGEYPIKENSFDCIVGNNLIEHLSNPDYYLSLFRKSLKPSGKLFLTTVNRKNRLYFWQKPYNEHHYTEYSVSTLKKLLLKHFDDVEILGIVKKPPFFPDYVNQAAARKFKLGVKFPVLNFLKRIKKVVLNKKEEDLTENLPLNVSNLALEKFSISDFEEAFKNICLDRKSPKTWIELFAICKKSK